MLKVVVDGVNHMLLHCLFIPYWNYVIVFSMEVSYSICKLINYQRSLVCIRFGRFFFLFYRTCFVDIILDDMIAHRSLPSEKRSIARTALLLKHIHQHEKEFYRHLHTQDTKKQLPFTRSLAELKRNRSQKDVTTSSVDQMPATGTNPNQTPTHKGTNETTPEKFLSGKS